jgi:HupE / UreJ protein
VRGLLLVVAFLLISPPARSHEINATYLRLRIDGAGVRGEIDLHIADAPAFFRRREALRIRSAERPCSLTTTPAPGQNTDPSLVRVSLQAWCDGPSDRLLVSYPLLAELDREHRAFLSVDDGRQTHSAILSAAQTEAVFDLAPTSAAGQFRPFLREGVDHVLTGFDHLLFLAALLLPAALVRKQDGWQPRARARDVLCEVLWVASAFTLAHSLTLTAAALGAVRPPARFVESAIALTVLLAALNNIAPLLRARAWQLALVLGLVHGFGFAAQLDILGLKSAARAVALFSFNLGVELGQLAAIALTLPLLLALRHGRFYRLGVLEIPSFAIAWIAGVWFVERAFGLTLLG